jgi:Zn-dependent peptidase ImmA (M78 family)
MDYSIIKVPFLDRKEIKRRADAFRQKFWDDSVPVDIEKIIDLKLKIDIIPLPNLRKLCDIDSQISFDLKSIYVDSDLYRDEKQQNRLRFSLAHEMGHYVLHKNLYRKFKLNNIYNFRQIILEKISEKQYGYLETQANKFASYLLVPRERLKIEKEKLLKRLENDPEFIKISDNKLQNSYLAIFLAGIFGVSQEVMEIVLSEEN